MKNSVSLSHILLSTGVFLWFYAITFIQLSNPFNTLITSVSCLFYSLLYLGLHQHIISGEIRRFILIGAFTITFTAFWANIVHLLFFSADLNAGKDPEFMILNSLIYAVLFLLFYKLMDNTHLEHPRPEQSQKTMQFILEVAFPIMAAICIFVSTLLLYTIMLQVHIGALLQESTGVGPLITMSAITIVVTILSTYLFEKWLWTVDKRTMEIVLFAITIAGALLTIILARI